MSEQIEKFASLENAAGIIVSALVILFFLGMIVLILLGQAPLGFTEVTQAWVLIALVLGAVCMFVSLPRVVRIGGTLATVLLLAGMAFLILRGQAPLGVADIKGLWPLVVLALGCSGIGSNLRSETRRRRR